VPVLTPIQILELFNAGRFDALVGTAEHDEVECKATPYHRIDDDRQRIELAKDISGLANANGGLIVFGASTERQDDTREDVVRRVAPFARNLFDVEQYHNVLSSWVYPPLQNVEFRWFDSGAGDGRGLVVAIIPPQHAKPYIVVRSLTDDDRRIDTLVGYFERRRAGVEHMTVQRIQTLLRDGLRFDDILSERFENLERLLIRNAAAPNPAAAICVDERLNDVITAAQLPEGPVYVLGATPNRPLQLRGFEQRDSDLARLVAEPPQLRPNGFDLGADRQAHVVRGELLRSRLAGWKAIDVWRDGFVAFAAPGNDDFLCWGRGPRGLINPLVLAESCYLFVELVRAVYRLADAPPETIEYRIGFRRAVTDDVSLSLPAYGLGALRGPILARQAPEANRDLVVSVPPETATGVVAFRLLQEVYLWFGHRREEMPYHRDRDNVTVLDPDLFR
jgi:hypothetical protein